MNYEHKYKEALKRTMNLALTNNISAIAASEIFPELLESKDEEIRKELIHCIQNLQKGVRTWNSDSVFYVDAIAWLEKQKTLTSDEYKQGKEDVLWCIKQARKNAKDENDMGTCWFAEKWLEKQSNIPHLTYDDILALQCAMKTAEKADNELYEQLTSLHDRLHDAYWLEKQGEQKPAWSEEDEKKIMWLVRLISTAGYRELDSDKMPCSRSELLDWLKSLKPRWKPSEEQMKAIKYFIDFHRPQANASTEGWN